MNYERHPGSLKGRFKGLHAEVQGEAEVEGYLNYNGKKQTMKGKAEGNAKFTGIDATADLEISKENERITCKGVHAKIGNMNAEGKASFHINDKKRFEVSGQASLNVASVDCLEAEIRKEHHIESQNISYKGELVNVNALNAQVIGTKTGKRSTVAVENRLAQVNFGNVSATGEDKRESNVAKTSGRLKTGATVNIANAEITGFGSDGRHHNIDVSPGVDLFNFRAGINRERGVNMSTRKGFGNVDLSIGYPKLNVNLSGGGGFNIGIPFFGGGGNSGEGGTNKPGEISQDGNNLDGDKKETESTNDGDDSYQNGSGGGGGKLRNNSDGNQNKNNDGGGNRRNVNCDGEGNMNFNQSEARDYGNVTEPNKGQYIKSNEQYNYNDKHKNRGKNGGGNSNNDGSSGNQINVRRGDGNNCTVDSIKNEISDTNGGGTYCTGDGTNQIYVSRDFGNIVTCDGTENNIYVPRAGGNDCTGGGTGNQNTDSRVNGNIGTGTENHKYVGEENMCISTRKQNYGSGLGTNHRRNGRVNRNGDKNYDIGYNTSIQSSDRQGEGIGLRSSRRNSEDDTGNRYTNRDRSDGKIVQRNSSDILQKSRNNDNGIRNRSGESNNVDGDSIVNKIGSGIGCVVTQVQDA